MYVCMLLSPKASQIRRGLMTLLGLKPDYPPSVECLNGGRHVTRP